MRKHFRRLLCILFANILIIPEMSSAWNDVGHVVIGEIAYQHLTAVAKIQADKLAILVFNRLPLAQQAKLDRRYPNASLFAKVAMLPDTDAWKKQKLSNLFSYFHAAVPLNLMLYSNATTADWHYIDIPYPNLNSDINVKSPNIVWALQKISADFTPHRADATNAILMVFTEHFVGDIYQPLHVMTHISANKQSDNGGNSFCVKRNAQGDCVINLHAVWDNAAGYLKPKKDILFYAHTLQKNYPKDKSTQQFFLSFKDIAKENYNYAAFIYSISPEKKLPAGYYRKLQDIAKVQLAKAGYALAEELNQDLIKLK